MDYKKYLYSLKFFVLFSFLFFVFSISYGYFSAKYSPLEAGIALEEIGKLFELILEAGPLEQLLFIILNNAFTLILVILLGVVLGIFPLLVLFGNGALLGIMAFLYLQESSLPVFFIGIVPHGIIEIPILLLTSAMGFKIGKKAFRKLLKKEEGLKKEISLAFKFFFKILIPFLILAAIIEVFITSWLLGI